MENPPANGPSGPDIPPDIDLLAELKLQEEWETLRWPKGFVCPHCGWRFGKECAGEQHRKLPSDPELAREPKDLLPRDNGRIICQECRKRVSVTSRTLLAGTHLLPSKIVKAIGHFLKAKTGISAMRLRSEATIALITARNLIGKFQQVMDPRYGSRLSGTVQIDECKVKVRPDNNAGDPQVIVIIAIEKNPGSANRIGLKVSDAPFDISLSDDAAKMIEQGSTIETRRPELYGKHLDQKFKVATVEGRDTKIGEIVLPDCSEVYRHVSDILQKKYRVAVSRERLQAYLDEIVFRWNNPDQQVAAKEMLRRLLQPPLEKLKRNKSIVPVSNDAVP